MDEQDSTTAPEMPQDATEPEVSTQDAIRADLAALRDLVTSLVRKKGYQPVEQVAILDMWVTSTLAELGALFYQEPEEREKFAYAVVVSRMRADLEYLQSKPDQQGRLIVPN